MIRDDWRFAAACRGMDPALFFVDGAGHDPRREAALAVCRACPVAADCLRDAIDTGEVDGIRGGLTPTARRRHAKREGLRPAQVCEVCGDPMRRSSRALVCGSRGCVNEIKRRSAERRRQSA